MAFMGIWAIPVPASSQPPRVRCLREDGRCLYVGTRLHRFRWHSVTLRSLYCRSYLIRSPRPKEKTWIFLVKCKPSFQVVTPGALWEDSRDYAPWEELPSHAWIMIPPPEAEEVWFGLLISPVITILSSTLLKKHAQLFAKFINSTCLQVSSRCPISLGLLAGW